MKDRRASRLVRGTAGGQHSSIVLPRFLHHHRSLSSSSQAVHLVLLSHKATFLHRHPSPHPRHFILLPFPLPLALAFPHLHSSSFLYSIITLSLLFSTLYPSVSLCSISFTRTSATVSCPPSHFDPSSRPPFRGLVSKVLSRNTGDCKRPRSYNPKRSSPGVW